MKGFLNRSRIEYIFFHLNYSFDFTDTIKSKIRFIRNGDLTDKNGNYIYFLLSDSALDVKKIIQIDNIPILFACSDSNVFYTFKNSSVIFNHDLLKSAFYLLSGYQEYIDIQCDTEGRFPFSRSLQLKQDIVRKPIVNYYFEIIKQGIKIFCDANNLKFTGKKIFENFGFILTHDIDRIDAYNFWETGYRLKQFLGLAPRFYSRNTALKEFFISIVNFLNFNNRKNPYWNFNFLRNIEKKNGLKSVFYLLEAETPHKDSRYYFKDKRIKELISGLENDGCEIGLHGTVNSSKDFESLNRTLYNLQSVSIQKNFGIRQHYLMYYLPLTALLHERAGFKYDSTLTFAEHEGFRNSCCTPFKLYDFDNERIIDIWELPLTIMDGTLFYYRKLSFEEILKSTEYLIGEIKKFHGLFILLWHNSMFDENEFPGITDFYEKYIRKICSYKPEALTGLQLTRKLSEFA